uniref:Uncharacterized protein n=1 Tax=Cryptomonas curvata TaxID=233186 RepID=A0A7S0MM53_9CRYP|mmetsp:Transcript_43159/g.90347  ORF Transcript_43159/g.90347 Transcript_43159/m.90347 type:complete len:179 (+) Transcript_43159:28-564(+)
MNGWSSSSRQNLGLTSLTQRVESSSSKESGVTRLSSLEYSGRVSISGHRQSIEPENVSEREYYDDIPSGTDRERDESVLYLTINGEWQKRRLVLTNGSLLILRRSVVCDQIDLKDIVSIVKLFDTQSDPNSKFRSSFYDSFALRNMNFGFNLGMPLPFFFNTARLVRVNKRHLTTFLA